MSAAAGFSRSRLRRLSDGMRGYVDRGELGHVVTLLYRRGQRAHADQISDKATEDMLIGRLDAHDKTIWMLRSQLD